MSELKVYYNQEMQSHVIALGQAMFTVSPYYFRGVPESMVLDEATSVSSLVTYMMEVIQDHKAVGIQTKTDRQVLEDAERILEALKMRHYELRQEAILQSKML